MPFVLVIDMSHCLLPLPRTPSLQKFESIALAAVLTKDLAGYTKPETFLYNTLRIRGHNACRFVNR